MFSWFPRTRNKDETPVREYAGRVGLMERSRDANALVQGRGHGGSLFMFLGATVLTRTLEFGMGAVY